MRLEGLGKLKRRRKKKISNLIANRNRDLSSCSIVPEPTTLLLNGLHSRNFIICAPFSSEITSLRVIHPLSTKFRDSL
jgi:hypothetical protein